MGENIKAMGTVYTDEHIRSETDNQIYKNYVKEHTRLVSMPDLESYFSEYRNKETKEMTLTRLILKLIRLRFKHGNLPVRTWVQYQGWCNLYEPKYVGDVESEGKFISIY